MENFEAIDSYQRIVKTQMPSWQMLHRELLSDSHHVSGEHRKLIPFLDSKQWKVRKILLSLFCLSTRFLSNSSNTKRICYNDPKRLFYFVLNQMYCNQKSEKTEEAKDLFFRNYNQLPCTEGTRNKRFELVARFVKKSEPILIVGDDDLQSLTLAKNGFSDITVIEIDPIISAHIKTEAAKNNWSIQLYQESIENVSAVPIRDYRALLMDPPCNYSGFSLFLKGSLSLCAGNSNRFLFLQTQPILYLESGYQKMLEDLCHGGFDLIFRMRGFNSYPIPLIPRKLINLLLKLMVPGIHGAPLQYFWSDATVFRF